jgi:hypothetical protein
MDIHEMYDRLKNKGEFYYAKMVLKNEKKYYVSGISSLDEFLAIYAIIVEEDIPKAKNLYYEAAMAIKYIIEISGEDPFVLIKNAFFPILSDSSKAIDDFLLYKPTPAHEKISAFQIHFGCALQAVLSDNKEELEKRIALASRKCTKGLFKQFEGIIVVFEGFLFDDVGRIENGIVDIIKKTIKKSESITKDYIHFEATGLAKLAWRKNLKVEIDSKLIPKQLLPFEELPHY